MDIAKQFGIYGSIVMRTPSSYRSINRGPRATKAILPAFFANGPKKDGKSIRRGSSIQQPYTTNPRSKPVVDGYHPALQDILEKSVRELGAIRLIDSRIGVPGQLARNPRVILGRFRTTIGFAWLRILVLLVNLRLHSIHSDIHRTGGSLGRNFGWTHDIDAAGLAGVASDRHHRWLGILDCASLTGHCAVVG